MSNPVSDPDAERDDRRRPTTAPERRGGPLRPLGVGTRNVIEGLLGLPMALADAAAYPVNYLYDALRPAPPLSGLITDQPRQPLFRPQGEVVAEILDRLGLPRAETAQERITGRVVQELAGAATMYGAGQTLVRGAGEIIPLVGRTLTTAPAAQATGAAAAGLAGGMAHEAAPDSPAADLAASLLGGAVGGALPLVLMRSGAGGAAAAARSTGRGQDAAAGVAARQTGQSERTTARAQQTAANDTAPAPRSNGDDAARAPADMPADATTPTAPAGGPAAAAPSSPVSGPSLATPAIITGSLGTGRPHMTAQQASDRLLRPSPPFIVEHVPGLVLPRAARESGIIVDRLGEWTAIPPHRRPALPNQPDALRQPMPWDALDVPQIMGRDLDATRLDVLAPGLLLPHGYRLSGRGDLALLLPHANQVVERLAEALDPVVVRLARGEHVPGATGDQIRAARLAEHYNMRPAYESILDAGLSPHAAMNRLQQEAAFLAATSPVTNTRASQRSAALYGNRFSLGRPIDSETMAAELTAGFNIMPSRHSPFGAEGARKRLDAVAPPEAAHLPIRPRRRQYCGADRLKQGSLYQHDVQ